MCYSAYVHKLDHKSTTHTMMYNRYYNSSTNEQNQDMWTNEQDWMALSPYRSA